jgi:hypothetical protein
LTFGLGIIILQGVSRRKSLAGVNIMSVFMPPKHLEIKRLTGIKTWPGVAE